MRLILFFIFITTFLFLSRAQDMSLLHATRGTHAGIYDEQGRHVLLRGANYNVLGQYWQGVAGVPTTREYDEHDFEAMEQCGFNCVRLLFTWSRVEPQRGHFDTAYIERIRRAVGAAARYHIYVLLDMHQDAWGMYVASPDSAACEHPAKGWDGAPQWATLTDGQPTCTRRGKGRESAPAVYRAFGNFWDDRDSLQEECIKAWSMVVAATAKYKNVFGYDLINEPNLGERNIFREDKLIGKYYVKLIKGIRATELANATPQHVVLFEASVTLRGKDYPSVPFVTFRPESNIVFSPHHYFESLGDQLNIEQGFGLFRFVSFFYHTDMMIGEWGFFGGARDTGKVKRFARQEDKYMIGSTWWQWSQACGDPHSVWWDGHRWQAGDRSMHLVELDRQGHLTGRVNTPVLNILSRTRPLAVCGSARGFGSDPDNGQFEMKAYTKKPGTTTVWIPERFGIPKIEGVNVGSVHMKSAPGGYIAEIAVKGRYKVLVSYRH